MDGVKDCIVVGKFYALVLVVPVVADLSLVLS